MCIQSVLSGQMNVNYKIDWRIVKLIMHLPKSLLLLPNDMVHLARTNYMFAHTEK